jgi:hypothetical protein
MAPKAPFLLNKRRKLAVFPARRIAYYSSGAEKTASAILSDSLKDFHRGAFLKFQEKSRDTVAFFPYA